jgi:predicted nucleotidyltransferase
MHAAVRGRDWLNDGAKGYLVGVTKGEVLYESRALQVRAASTAQLLAMKLAAWRDAIDRSDAKLLLSQMTGTADENMVHHQVACSAASARQSFVCL